MSRKTSFKSKMTIQSIVMNSQDEIGGVVPVVVSNGTFACRIRRLAADEKFIGGMNGVVSTHRIYCSNKISLEPKDKVIIDKKLYDINTVDESDCLIMDATLRG